MPKWRAVLGGVVAFVLAVLAAAAYEPPSLLVAGFAGGVVAGALAGGLKSGVWHGFLTGVAALLLAVGALAALLATYDPEYVRPGVGYSMVFVPLLGVLYLVESTVAGVVGLAIR